MKILSMVCSSILIVAVLLHKTFPDSLFHLIFCDVGQGDALVFSLRFVQVVIDVGKNDQVVTCLEKNLPWWDRKIEVLALTHPDSDHTGGFSSLSKRYEIDLVLHSVGMYSDEVTGFCQVSGRCREFGQHSILSFSNVENDFSIEGLWPVPHSRKAEVKQSKKPEAKETQRNELIQTAQSTDIEGDNNHSLVLNVRYGSISTLVMGDVDTEVDLSLIRGRLLNKSLIVKIAHHGSKFSTSEEFIRVVNPEVALIGVGKNNPFGHPSARVIDLLRSSNIKIYRTDEDGTVHLVSDGQRAWRHEEPNQLTLEKNRFFDRPAE